MIDGWDGAGDGAGSKKDAWINTEEGSGKEGEEETGTEGWRDNSVRRVEECGKHRGQPRQGHLLVENSPDSLQFVASVQSVHVHDQNVHLNVLEGKACFDHTVVFIRLCRYLLSPLLTECSIFSLTLCFSFCFSMLHPLLSHWLAGTTPFGELLN